MNESTMEKRQKIAAELAERHGKSIEASSSELYEDEPAAIGIAVTYFACGCVLLRCFDEGGDIIGAPRTIGSKTSCALDHIEKLKDDSEAAVYNSILWKEPQEEFDRKYGNEKRIVIAHKLFPPSQEE